MLEGNYPDQSFGVVGSSSSSSSSSTTCQHKRGEQRPHMLYSDKKIC